MKIKDQKKFDETLKLIFEWWFKPAEAFNEMLKGIKPIPNVPVGKIYYLDFKGR